MSVYFCSDFHLSHKNIAKFRPFVKDVEDNTRLLIDSWNLHIKKNDVVYCLGDMAFDKNGLDALGNLKGRKILIRGNHCDFVSIGDLINVFEEVHGMISYKRLWLTHCPIHPHEMRGRVANVHGHVHTKSIKKKTWYGAWKDDPQYINTCVDHVYEKTGGKTVFTSLEEIKAKLNIK